MQTITITELRRHFSKYIARAAAGERFIILRRAQPLVVIVGERNLKLLDGVGQITRAHARALGQSASLLKQIAAGKMHPAMAASGLWEDEEDLADLDQRVLENRRAFLRSDKVY